jgi:hypothetical protein
MLHQLAPSVAPRAATIKMPACEVATVRSVLGTSFDFAEAIGSNGLGNFRQPLRSTAAVTSPAIVHEKILPRIDISPDRIHVPG